ncbi:MAG: sporulation transcription factor Spo0A [Clostridiales bacterium]|jgi:two-component system response regulator (stage 0 sporulation protein A)|nr:sporulation transcription factor Spo0A [Clostridiales bacterium]
MPQVITVIIADDSKESATTLSGLLIRQGDIKVLYIAKDGNEAVDKTRELNPDFLILSGMLCELDALGVLEKLDKKNNPKSSPKCIVLSRITQDEFAQEAINLGADYYMAKPFDVEALVRRIRSLNENVYIGNDPRSIFLSTYSGSGLESHVTNILHRVGVPAHIRGYYYIREGILLAVDNMDILNYVTKELYPTISKKFNTTSSRVERAIRHAIEVAWTRGKIDELDSFFGYTINNAKGKPTNSEFIALIADRLRLELKAS